ncbi:mCG147897 [Mus musculus]|nr:mCG147897 [Mus musculus]
MTPSRATSIAQTRSALTRWSSGIPGLCCFGSSQGPEAPISRLCCSKGRKPGTVLKTESYIFGSWYKHSGNQFSGSSENWTYFEANDIP